jgi:hypothetical protein
LLFSQEQPFSDKTPGSDGASWSPPPLPKKKSLSSFSGI